MMSSNENIFRVTGPLCRKFTGPGEFPAQRPVTWSFDVFFDLRLNKRLSKQPWGWWFETPSWSLWRQLSQLIEAWTIQWKFYNVNPDPWCLGVTARVHNELTHWGRDKMDTDDIFKCIFSNENVWFVIKISLKFVPKGLINNISALVQVMTWCCPGYKPLYESMMVSVSTHICVARPQWVNILKLEQNGQYIASTFSIFFSIECNMSWLKNWNTCCQRSGWQKVNIGSGDSLSPVQCQSITWTNVDHNLIYDTTNAVHIHLQTAISYLVALIDKFRWGHMSVCLRGFWAFYGESMEGMAWNLVCCPMLYPDHLQKLFDFNHSVFIFPL